MTYGVFDLHCGCVVMFGVSRSLYVFVCFYQENVHNKNEKQKCALDFKLNVFHGVVIKL